MWLSCRLCNGCSTTSILLMFALFVLILASTYWPGRKSRLEKYGHIPLEDDR